MLSGTASHQGHTAQLLDLFCLIKPSDVTHLCQYPRQDVVSNATDLQNILGMWNLPPFQKKFLLDFGQF